MSNKKAVKHLKKLDKHCNGVKCHECIFQDLKYENLGRCPVLSAIRISKKQKILD